MNRSKKCADCRHYRVRTTEWPCSDCMWHSWDKYKQHWTKADDIQIRATDMVQHFFILEVSL